MSSTSRAMAEDGTPFIILGADAVLAALPASPVQLAHACHLLGFQLAAPATWGDELIAESCLDQLADYEHQAAVMCSCPLVTERLTRASMMLEPFMLTFVSPPVATARYIRAAFSGQALHITYAGACPGAADDSIDARITPAELLEAFAERAIVLGAQPNHFDALVPLDRRRFYSLPGGVPTRDHVERAAGRSFIEVTGDDVVLELTQQLIEQTPALLDIAVPLGCACAGAGEHAMRGNVRAGLLTLEPPRARTHVIDQSLHLDVTQSLVELCELHMGSVDSAEEPAALEVHLAADSAPAPEEPMIEIDVTGVDVIDVASMDVASIDAKPIEIEIELPPEIASTNHAVIPAPRKRPVVSRAPASIPRYANARGELVPRASLAVLRRALARIAKRKARRQPKVERGRRERAMEIHDGLVRTTPRTPRSLAIAGSADLPRPVPPPPARHRPRTMMEL
ncbi:MAG: hypothetical protein H0U66_08390 [Gemmatimonadaceae bacterium]|nr:hypothetical protein [Gemmatimonadaceae bacterium]